MRFDLTRLAKDPTYAPGRVVDRGRPTWRPGKADIAAGFAIKSDRLYGDELEQAARCRDLTRELLRWREGEAKVQPGTWGWIMSLYRSDPLSPLFDVKENTKRSYLDEISYWENAISTVLIADTNFERLKLWKKAMETNFRARREAENIERAGWNEIESVRPRHANAYPFVPRKMLSEDPTAFVHRKFTHLRMIANYGLAKSPRMFSDVCAVLSTGAIKVRSPKPRTVAPTAAQVSAIIAKADEWGDHAIALGISLQWWLTLRAVDVRGQWLGTGKDKRWADGLTWDMIDLKQGVIRKMISKTEKHDMQESFWDISGLPTIMQRLSAIPLEERIGPVIKNRNSRPFPIKVYRDRWRRYARLAGVPEEVLLLDTRAGAINDGLRSGADKLQVQHAANHKSSDTTERYIRVRDSNANEVIRLRSRTNE